MRRKVAIVLFIGICWTVFTIENEACALNYMFKSIDASDARETYVNGINDSGQIVGYIVSSSDEVLGFLLQDGNYSPIRYPGAIQTWAYGINNVGQIVGGYYSDPYYAPIRNGFLIEGGSYILTNPPNTTGEFVNYSINDAGTILGTYYPNNIFASSGYLWNNGSYVSLSKTGILPNGTWGLIPTEFFGINNAAKIVGSTRKSAFEWDTSTSGFLCSSYDSMGNLTDLQLIDLGITTVATGINKNDEVVGYYYGQSQHGFMLSSGSLSLLDFPGGVTATIPRGINSAGQIVGWYQDTAGMHHGFLATPRPDANAGADQTVHLGKLVTLDGSGSSDHYGFVPLTYAWSFNSKPAGSTATISNPIVNPTFTPDLPGNYEVQLVVTNSQGLASQPATVTISTNNSPPVASAGPDQVVTAKGFTVQLDGSQSYDPDGDPITYQWSFVYLPPNSTAKLDNPNIVNPTFVVDMDNTTSGVQYGIQLVVSDSWTQSTPATVWVSFVNVAPVANAGTSQSAIVGDTVTLDGSASFDANGDSLLFAWYIVSKPDGSNSFIDSNFSSSPVTSFVPDLPGVYVVQLQVYDGFVYSLPSTVQVQVVSKPTEVIANVRNIELIIGSLDGAVFKNLNMKNALINKLNAVIANLNDSNYSDALDQLQNDILGKTDGCAKGGFPDKNDWIINCQSQNQVYPSVMNLIKVLQTMK